MTTSDIVLEVLTFALIIALMFKPDTGSAIAMYDRKHERLLLMVSSLVIGIVIAVEHSRPQPFYLSVCIFGLAYSIFSLLKHLENLEFTYKENYARYYITIFLSALFAVIFFVLTIIDLYYISEII